MFCTFWICSVLLPVLLWKEKILGQGTMNYQIIFGRHYLLSYEAAWHFPFIQSSSILSSFVRGWPRNGEPILLQRLLIHVRMSRKLMVLMMWLYFVGLDGNTSAQERERLINRFNAPDNTDVLLFMLSTRSAIVVYKNNFLSSVKVLQSKLLLHSAIGPGISCYLPKSTNQRALWILEINWSDFLIIFNVLLTIKSPLLVRRVYIYINFIRQRAIRGKKRISWGL